MIPAHAKWDLLRKLNNLPVSIRTEEMVAYTKGYILALEDVLSDISTEREDEPAPDDGYVILGRVEVRVTESLESARSTLEALTRKKTIG